MSRRGRVAMRLRPFIIARAWTPKCTTLGQTLAAGCPGG